MGRLNPEKLTVEFRTGVTPTEPIIPRRYTLTHSDTTGQLFLDIGREYAFDKITSMRDEVFAQWVEKDGKYLYTVYLYVDNGEFPPAVTAIRNQVFIRELPLALEAIRYGDREFFKTHDELNNAPIIVYFKSKNPQIKRVEKWGTFSNYENRRKSTAL
ncbi:staygreen family protein [Clostridium malenominatum]|uniref:Staygreen family protein n=1 Tax=Clostridium malenominatum TaxID=1539 RepID=A0ABP3U090_9CLOT